MSKRPVVFKWRHFEPRIILRAVRWYLRFSLSNRDLEELLAERGVAVGATIRSGTRACLGLS